MSNSLDNEGEMLELKAIEEDLPEGLPNISTQLVQTVRNKQRLEQIRKKCQKESDGHNRTMAIRYKENLL